jgi:hypothetical protein
MSNINSTELYNDDAGQLIRQVEETQARVEDESDEDATKIGDEDY